MAAAAAAAAGGDDADAALRTRRAAKSWPAIRLISAEPTVAKMPKFRGKKPSAANPSKAHAHAHAHAYSHAYRGERAKQGDKGIHISLCSLGRQNKARLSNTHDAAQPSRPSRHAQVRGLSSRNFAPPPFFFLAAATGLPVHMHGCSFDMRTRGSPTHRNRGHFPRSTLCLSSCAAQPAKAIHCSALLLGHVGSIVGPAAHTRMVIGLLTGTAIHARKASKSKGVEPARRC